MHRRRAPMPFKQTCRMEQLVRLLADYDSGAFTMRELCARDGISRETFYVWARRRPGGEADWFVDRSHAPLSRTAAGSLVRRRPPGPTRPIQRRDQVARWLQLRQR